MTRRGFVRGASGAAADKVFKDLSPGDAHYLQETAAAVWGEFGKEVRE